MKTLSFFILIFFLFSCQTLPVINPQSFQDNKKTFICPHPFLKEKYRLVHTIEVRMAGNTQSAVLGVTLADPVPRSVSCAIITAEGIVLFEAESSPEGIKVNRALPPFDAESLAKNMMEDIKLIFLAPDGKFKTKGLLPDGAKTCRYLQENGDWIDVIENESSGTQIKRYSSSGALERHVRFNNKGGDIYESIGLQAKELFDYSLLMTLIEAQPVKTKNLKRK